ncbi:MAG: sigma 54-interacting transcriptional regulator [Sporomusaceae bacterium]|nr:sigma 54-interacting transcriptional regulator [Sporomusaceae bacterium]
MVILQGTFTDREQLYQMILDTQREGVNVIDINGNIIYANKSSAIYAHADQEGMIGKHITEYYPRAVLLQVLKSKGPVRDFKTVHDDGRTFIVNAFPLFSAGNFAGGVATFRDITEIEELSRQLETLEMELAFSQVEDVFENFVGKGDSLEGVLEKAQRCIAAIGGPRHSVITGETGTGKTMLAKAMYYFAVKNGIVRPNAPFIEVNCGQFTNADIAAMEIFGTDKGAFTGAAEKPGLVELANGGVLFLDEAHSLVQHQTMLLKLIESGMVRRIGGRKDREVELIVIAASSKNLKKEFVPELYQRLAQYQIELPPLAKRSLGEKQALFDHFVMQYCERVRIRQNLILNVRFTEQSKEIILNAHYERNVRQFRDVINASIDAAAPLVNKLSRQLSEISVVVHPQNIPVTIIDEEPVKASQVDGMIQELAEKGFGARKIATKLQSMGYAIEYYHVAYKLKRLRNSV